MPTSRIEPYAHLVGVVTDREVADLAGVSPQSVAQWRSRRGIPRAPAYPDATPDGREDVHFYLTPAELEELDREVRRAESPSRSAYIRTRLGFKEA